MLIPNALFAILLISFVVALSVAGLALFKRKVPGQALAVEPEPGGQQSASGLLPCRIWLTYGSRALDGEQ